MSLLETINGATTKKEKKRGRRKRSRPNSGNPLSQYEFTELHNLPAEKVGADEAHHQQQLGMKQTEIKLSIPSRVRYLICAALFEFVGSFFFFMFLHLSRVLNAGTPTQLIFTGITIAFSFIGIRAALGAYSTGFYNIPLVWGNFLGYMFSRSVDGKEMFPNFNMKLLWGGLYSVCYTLAIVGGSILAMLAVNQINGSGDLGVSDYSHTLLNKPAAVGFVILCTMLLMYLYYRFNADYRDNSLGIGTIAIGFYMGASYIALSPLVGVPFNMMSFVAPGIIAPSPAHWQHCWVWIVGPIAGVVAGWILYEFVRKILMPHNSYVYFVHAMAGPQQKNVPAHYMIKAGGREDQSKTVTVGIIRQ